MTVLVGDAVYKNLPSDCVERRTTGKREGDV